ncbi:hypothetical protein EDC01DRAFT_760381 [Geopyxis carbonaria]|nr:hypothetical protein EDC01DRAFT_760381 [Geopyxis carbonaria]
MSHGAYATTQRVTRLFIPEITWTILRQPAISPHNNTMDPLDLPPPTYETATSRDPLPLLAPYLTLSSLPDCILVSKAWKAAFTPALYAAPHKLFDVCRTRSAFTSFTLFLRTVNTATKALPTTTLVLSGAQLGDSIFTALPRTWLASLLAVLPALTSLHCIDLAFLSHAALTAPYAAHTSLIELSLVACTNATSTGLVSLLTHLPNLQNLSLSATPPEPTGALLYALIALPIKRLGLSHSPSLTSPLLAPLLISLGTRLHALDLSGTAITAETLETLSLHATAPPSYSNTTPAQGLQRLRIAATPASVTAIPTTLNLTHLDLGCATAPRRLPAQLRFLRTAAYTVMRPDGLRRGASSLQHLVLVDVPKFAPPDATQRLVHFCAPPSKQKDVLRIVDLDMAMEADGEWGDGEFGAEEEGFSFWEGGSAGGLESEEARKVDVIKAVAKGRYRPGSLTRVRVLEVGDSGLIFWFSQK